MFCCGIHLFTKNFSIELLILYSDFAQQISPKHWSKHFFTRLQHIYDLFIWSCRYTLYSRYIFQCCTRVHEWNSCLCSCSIVLLPYSVFIQPNILEYCYFFLACTYLYTYFCCYQVSSTKFCSAVCIYKNTPCLFVLYLFCIDARFLHHVPLSMNKLNTFSQIGFCCYCCCCCFRFVWNRTSVLYNSSTLINQHTKYREKTSIFNSV